MMTMTYRDAFPINCGRCYRVQETERVEPVDQLGYLYLIKSPDTSEYILSWEPIGEKDDRQSADQVWRIPTGSTTIQLKRIPNQEAFVLLMGPGIPPRFFWFNTKEVPRVELACKLFPETIRIPPRHPPTEFGFKSDESEAAKATRALLQASLTFQAPIDPYNPVNRPAPTPSTLDPWLPLPESVKLSHILQPKSLLPLLSDPGVLDRILPLLPTDLSPSPSTSDDVLQLIRSPQFRTALETFDLGLKCGELSQVTTQLGLDGLAGRGTANFLAAIQNAVDQEVAQEYPTQSTHPEEENDQ